MPLFAAPTPTITLPTPIPTDAQPTGTMPRGGGVRVEIDPDTVQSVIAVLDRPESYSRRVDATLEGAVFTTWVHVDGDWTRCDTATPTGLAIRTIVGDGQVWRWYNAGPLVAVWPADDASADVDGQRIPTYEDVLALDKSAITAAGYEEKNGVPCVYVEVAIPEPEQTERYWVSAENGLLIAAETESGGETVYSMTAQAPETLASPLTEKLFVLPDGTALHKPGQE